jgi:hypothetical protein
MKNQATAHDCPRLPHPPRRLPLLLRAATEVVVAYVASLPYVPLLRIQKPPVTSGTRTDQTAPTRRTLQAWTLDASGS